jgi:hypothetical protein
MARRAGRAGRGLAGVSVAALEAELVRRERVTRRLHRARERLLGNLARIEREIMGLGGSVSGGRRRGGGRGRARNAKSLVDALAEVLSGKTMSVTDAAEAVRRSGYHTSSPNFRTMVNQSLLKKDRFRRVGRGQYTSK